MKFLYIFYIILISLFFCSCSDETIEVIPAIETIEVAPAIEIISNNKIDLPEILDGLPVEIEVINEPEIIYAIQDPKDTNIYIWRLKTFLRSLSDDIIITAFGDYVKDKNDEWYLHNYTGKNFKQTEFNEWYFVVNNGHFTWKNVKNGIVKKGEKYVDPVNWTNRSDTLCPQKGIWFFIGINNKGEKVCGYDEYENIAEIKK